MITVILNLPADCMTQCMNISEFKNILWDFDGVILFSNEMRTTGFKKIFANYDKKNVDELITYHERNGGLSRFDKIKYFFEKILKQPISPEKLTFYCKKFSKIMRSELIDESYLNKDAMNFIRQNFKNIDFHIVSASEENELKFLCTKHGLDKYFLSISGSPSTKIANVERIIYQYHYDRKQTLLIGDSINDFHCSKHHRISFGGYNNKNLKKVASNYIESFC